MRIREEVAKILYKMTQDEVARDIRIDKMITGDRTRFRRVSWLHLGPAHKKFYYKQADAVIAIVKEGEK